MVAADGVPRISTASGAFPSRQVHINIGQGNAAVSASETCSRK